MPSRQHDQQLAIQIARYVLANLHNDADEQRAIHILDLAKKAVAIGLRPETDGG